VFINRRLVDAKSSRIVTTVNSSTLYEAAISTCRGSRWWY
jgi:hypothetical protein